MTRFRLTGLLIAGAAIALAPGASIAQRQPPSPDERIKRLEKQVDQVQRKVFPKGRPADTAGFSDDPAASQASVISLDQRINSVERQMRDILRQLEENNFLLRKLDSQASNSRKATEGRIQALEQRLQNMVLAPNSGATEKPAVPAKDSPAKPKPASAAETKPTTTQAAVSPGETPGAPTGDPAEDAYSEGFYLWRDGKYDKSISALRAFTKAYPQHRRVSYANNLVGRALLDKGEPRAAAQAFLANYRDNPKGERAQDSLFYLGQSLAKLGQTGQACKAYAELEAVYGAALRADVAKLVDAAKRDAKC